jgi:hypothetical protein
VRPPTCLECYENHPPALRRQLERLFTARGGPGLPRDTAPDNQLRAALAPHIDYVRGGVAYGWAFKEIVERSAASLFVILATSHHSEHRFTLTRKSFQTPLGIVPTDQAYLDRLEHHYGPGLFDDELLAHFPEHSVELEVVLLQYLFERRRPIRIVPLVVGSFHDCLWSRVDPAALHDIGRMIATLRKVEAETPEPICYVISGDLAHIGPKFGDPEPVTASAVEHCRRQDLGLLQHLEAADPESFFRFLVEEKDQRRICGFPPTYTLMAALQPERGKLLHYDQYTEPNGFESVSFASLAFYGSNGSNGSNGNT